MSGIDYKFEVKGESRGCLRRKYMRENGNLKHLEGCCKAEENDIFPDL